MGQHTLEVYLDKESTPGAPGGALKGVNYVKFQNTTPTLNIKLDRNNYIFSILITPQSLEFL